MAKYSVIPGDTFDHLQMNAGVLLNKFNPASPEAIADEDFICSTTGGISASCVPTYSDFGEDIDNCPANLKEMKHLDGWNCTLGFTALTMDVDAIKMALGAADVDSGSKKITPRAQLKQTDFTDSIWWVGDRTDGGFVAIQLKNALSTGGFSLQTTKNGKGQVSVELTGHVSISAQDEVPMVFYSIAGAA